MNKRSRKTTESSFPINWTFLLIGIATIIVGYILLSIPPAEGFWSLTAAPIVLITGYCVIIPIALLKGKERKSE